MNIIRSIVDRAGFRVFKEKGVLQKRLIIQGQIISDEFLQSMLDYTLQMTDHIQFGTNGEINIRSLKIFMNYCKQARKFHMSLSMIIFKRYCERDEKLMQYLDSIK